MGEGFGDFASRGRIVVFPSEGQNDATDSVQLQQGGLQ